ncbi:unnamed protein product [Pleuronectes platessa]|uniref:Uncharacterized protein n=1 Tax=Pleuronectes platessa TaxID=8262 RepID=A0A9N7TK42_PLEPL|nr:unnamed protein product [Pleuronectes platessa]
MIRIHHQDPLPPSGSTISCHLHCGPPPLSDANTTRDGSVAGTLLSGLGWCPPAETLSTISRLGLFSLIPPSSRCGSVKGPLPSSHLPPAVPPHSRRAFIGLHTKLSQGRRTFICSVREMDEMG